MSGPGRKNGFNQSCCRCVVSFKDERDEKSDVKLELTCGGYRQRLNQGSNVSSNCLYCLETGKYIHRYKQEVLTKAKGVQSHVGFQVIIPGMWVSLSLEKRVYKGVPGVEY